MIDGLMRLNELEELLGADLQAVNRGDVGTVGGLVMALLDRLPQVGDEVGSRAVAFAMGGPTYCCARSTN